MSFDDDRQRFTFPRHIGAAYYRHLLRRGRVIQAWNCRQAGDEAGFARFMALADEARTHSLSEGPPVSIADRRPDPPASED